MNETMNKSKIMTTTKLILEKEDNEEENEEKKKMRALKFPSCSINKPSSQSFILKNLSGIQTTFNFRSVEFEPEDLVLPPNIQGKSSLEDLPKQDMDETISYSKPGSKSSKRETKIRFALTNKTKKGLKVKQLKRPMLTDTHEYMNKFSSKTGETLTATKRLEKEQAFYLSNNKGLAVVFTPAFGELKPHSEIPVNVTVYNNACGSFQDTLVSEIKGLPPFRFPVHVSVNGSPLVIPENQVGLNYFTSPPTLAFPTVVDNSPQLTKTFKIRNTGIADVLIDWKIFDERDQKKRKQDEDLFNISVDKNTGFDSEDNPYKLKFDLVEPEQSYESPFVIKPQQIIIPARETQFFNVFFNSNEGVETFKSVVLAHPQLAEHMQSEKGEEQYANQEDESINKRRTVDLYDIQSDSSEDEYQQQLDSRHMSESEYNQEKEYNNEQDFNQQPDSADINNSTGNNTERENAKRSLGIVALKLFAKTIEPVLTVDMKKKLDGEYYFNFYQWPMDHEEEPSPIQKMCLVNETKANLIFNLNSSGPFKIIGTKTNSGSSHPLAPKRPSSRGLKGQVDTMFSLQPDKLVQLKVEFSPPNPNSADWPLVKSYIQKGLINVAFANGKMQQFSLLGNLLRPKVSIITEKP